MVGRALTARLGATTAIAIAVLTTGMTSGCSGEGSDVSCDLETCTVTFDRGVDAEASVLGVTVTLVSVENDTVTLDVNGSQISMPAGDTDQSTEAGGLNVSVDEVTSDQVVLTITQA